MSFVNRFKPLSAMDKELMKLYRSGRRTPKLNAWYDKHIKKRELTPEYAKFKEWSQAFLKTKQWKTIRQGVIQEHNGLCAYCKHRRLSRLGRICDHIIPRVLIYFRWIKDSREDMFNRWYERSNLWLICEHCHRYKTDRIEPVLNLGVNLNHIDKLLFEEMGLYPRFKEWIKYIKLCQNK